jgi:CBS domain-containing protein
LETIAANLRIGVNTRERADWRSIMKARDAMTPRVITVTADAPIEDAVRLMLQNKISGLPIVDAQGKLIGIVTEGDFLRRAETGTERKRSPWLAFFANPNKLAREFVHAHGRRVEDVMTCDVWTATEDTPLEEVVTLMEKHRVKRVPVMGDGKLVGIISRANLLHALAGLAREASPVAQSDQTIRDRVLAELESRRWAPIDVTVRNGIVELWGVVFAAGQRDAARVAAENVPGVKSVQSHIVWVEPMSGMAISDPEDAAKGGPASTSNAA